MTILLVLPNNASAWVMWKNTLEDLGYRVELFYYRTLARPKLTTVERIARKLLRVDSCSRMNQKLVETVEDVRPDAVIVNKGEMIYPETVKIISQDLGIRTASWHVDSPLWVNTSTLHIVNSIRFYDISFVFEQYYIPEMKRLGCKTAEALSFGCDPTIHRTVELTHQEKEYYGSPVCFVGNYQGFDSDREKVLSQLLDYEIKIWGEGWQRSPNKALKAKWTGRAVNRLELAKVYSPSHITLNITYPHSVTQPNMRTFEAPACGILLINDRLSGLSNFFDIGKEIEVYTNVRELRDKIEYYLAHPEQAQAIGRAGQKRAHRDHTYRERLEHMLKAIWECPK